MIKPIFEVKSPAWAKSVAPRSSTSGGTSRNLSSSNCLNLIILVALSWIKVLRVSVPSQKMNCETQNISVSLTFSCSFLIFMTLQVLLPSPLHRTWFNIALWSPCPLLLPWSYRKTNLQLKVVSSYIQISRVPAALRSPKSNFKMIYHCNLC